MKEADFLVGVEGSPRVLLAQIFGPQSSWIPSTSGSTVDRSDLANIMEVKQMRVEVAKIGGGTLVDLSCPS